jgi:hypothetical protein
MPKKKRILTGPNQWQQVCNQSNPENTGGSCEWADFSWLTSKASPTLFGENTKISTGFCPQNKHSLPGGH